MQRKFGILKRNLKNVKNEQHKSVVYIYSTEMHTWSEQHSERQTRLRQTWLWDEAPSQSSGGLTSSFCAGISPALFTVTNAPTAERTQLHPRILSCVFL